MGKEMDREFNLSWLYSQIDLFALPLRRKGFSQRGEVGLVQDPSSKKAAFRSQPPVRRLMWKSRSL